MSCASLVGFLLFYFILAQNDAAIIVQDLCKSCRTFCYYILFYILYYILFYYKWTNRFRNGYASSSHTKQTLYRARRCMCCADVIEVMFLCQLAAVASAVTEDNRETILLFQRLSIALQRGNAGSFQNTTNTTTTFCYFISFDFILAQNGKILHNSCATAIFYSILFYYKWANRFRNGYARSSHTRNKRCITHDAACAVQTWLRWCSYVNWPQSPPTSITVRRSAAVAGSVTAATTRRRRRQILSYCDSKRSTCFSALAPMTPECV